MTTATRDVETRGRAFPPRRLLDRPPITALISQHVEELSHLRHLRSLHVRAPHIGLSELERLDRRIEAHADGLAVAGEWASIACQDAIATLGIGEFFAATLHALDTQDQRTIEMLARRSAESVAARRGVVSAFGWRSPTRLRGVVAALFVAADPAVRMVAMAACRLHRVHPGPVLSEALRGPDDGLSIEAVRVVGTLGLVGLREALLNAGRDPDSAAAAYHMAVAQCAIGAAATAHEALRRLVTARGPYRIPAARWLFLSLPTSDGRSLLRDLWAGGACDAETRRLSIRASGWLGDTTVLPWLVDCMREPLLARLAGDSFSVLTGLDLARDGLTGDPPAENVADQAPPDESVDVDEDEDLPYPDADEIARWLERNAAVCGGASRSFLGRPWTTASCRRALQEEPQGRREVAATLLTLLEPGTASFNTASPAWRQKRQLGMS